MLQFEHFHSINAHASAELDYEGADFDLEQEQVGGGGPVVVHHDFNFSGFALSPEEKCDPGILIMQQC